MPSEDWTAIDRTADRTGDRAEDRVEHWKAIDRWFAARLVGADPELDAVVANAAAAGLPAHQVSPLQGRLLQLLAVGCGARSVLEIGTLAGYSTVWLARAVAPDGRVVTVELDPERAALARTNLDGTGVGAVVEVLTGDALEVMAQLDGPFDLVFIDADKTAAADHLAGALRLSHPGTLIVVDNVVRNDASRLVEHIEQEPRLHATAVQTVGEKGHDGFLLAVVTA